MFRVFSRPVWERNKNWPNGYKPLAQSSSPYAEFDTTDEAILCCDERNMRWKRLINQIRTSMATPVQNKVYHESRRYEWTEV